MCKSCAFLNREVGMEFYADIVRGNIRGYINYKAVLLMEPPLIWVDCETPAHNNRSTLYSQRLWNKEYDVLYREYGVRVW
jgi:hypothetical protein